jgi:mono/diheme cytochrome c family protein
MSINGTRLLLSVAAFAALAAATVSPAAAVETGFAGNGEAFALEICSDCHVVSDRQVRVDTVKLPSFRAVANDPKYSEHWLRTFMRTPHFEMPNFILTDQQLDDLLAYIDTLKE